MFINDWHRPDADLICLRTCRECTWASDSEEAGMQIVVALALEVVEVGMAVAAVVGGREAPPGRPSWGP